MSSGPEGLGHAEARMQSVTRHGEPLHRVEATSLRRLPFARGGTWLPIQGGIEQILPHLGAP